MASPTVHAGTMDVHAIVNAVLLGLLAAAAALAASLDVTPAGTVRVPWLGMDLPETCVYRTELGVSCPSCGLTRSLVTALHGDWDRSRAFHPGGLPLLLTAGVQAAMRLLFLRPRLRSLRTDIALSSAMLGVAAFLVRCG